MQPNVDLSALLLPHKPNADTVRAYAMLIGELVYLTVNTMPCIAYAVSCLVRYMTNSTASRYAHAKQTLRYLTGVKSPKIKWCTARVRYPLKSCEICAFADPSWADAKPSRKALGQRCPPAPDSAHAARAATCSFATTVLLMENVVGADPSALDFRSRVDCSVCLRPRSDLLPQAGH